MAFIRSKIFSTNMQNRVFILFCCVLFTFLLNLSHRLYRITCMCNALWGQYSQLLCSAQVRLLSGLLWSSQKHWSWPVPSSAGPTLWPGQSHSILKSGTTTGEKGTKATQTCEALDLLPLCSQCNWSQLWFPLSEHCWLHSLWLLQHRTLLDWQCSGILQV